MGSRALHNERGVALLIVLLVTALLVALVFEFAYGTRVSLRAAVNFRDSQRAYYLARSGVNFAGKILNDNLKNNKLQDNLEQREWMVVPVVSGGDMELRVRWDDECGKINIGPDLYNNSLAWLKQLLENSGTAPNVIADKIKDEKNNKINLVAELRQFLSDEEFAKVQDHLTTNSDGKIDVNTAPEAVLKSVLTGPGTTPESIILKRSSGPITSLGGMEGVNTTNFSTTSDYFKIYSHATVGEYTRQVEAVIRRSPLGFTVLYWRSL